MESDNIVIGKINKKKCYLNNEKHGHYLNHDGKNYKVPEWFPVDKFDVRVAALAERLGGFGTCAPGTWSPRASAYGHSWPGPHANRDGRKLGTAIGTPYESRPLTMTPVPRRRSIPGPGRLG